MKKLGFWICFILIFAWIGGAYFRALPSTVQMGDTGELVAAAEKLLVVHPPGYPLWIWLQHFFLQWTDGASVFFRASLLNMFFSLGALVFTWGVLKERKRSEEHTSELQSRFDLVCRLL